MVEIRPATQEDRIIIRQMVFAKHLDPTSLNWRNFLIAEREGDIVGIGQVKSFPGCRELGSLIVKRSARRQGIARLLIQALEQKSGYPLFLLCRSHLEGFYAQFGYQAISWQAAPTALKIKLLPARLLQPFGLRVSIMRKDGAIDSPPQSSTT